MKKAVRFSGLLNQSNQISLRAMAGEGTRGEFTRFLPYSLASCDETTDHLETLFETGSLQDKLL